MTGYRIMKLRDGGYVVGELVSPEDHLFRPALFACTKISDALEYIREHLEKLEVSK